MSLRRLSTGLALLVLVGVLPASAQTSRTVLDVPYLAQKGDLAGGAAVTMVLRYWGETQFGPRDFPATANAALAQSITARGWRTQVVDATDDGADRLVDLQRALELGQPPIVLVEVAPNTRHYVVVLAITGRDVVLHDPARRPFETMSRRVFDEVWGAAGSWAMLVLPATDPMSKPRFRQIETTVPADLPEDAECATLIANAIAASKAGDRTDTERHLSGVAARCPENAAGWREVAGLQFVNSQWEEARQLAQKAVRLSPQDKRSWRILAASLFLEGDTLGALRAWNRAGDPRVESVILSGANRTHPAVIMDRIGLSAGEVMSPSAFRRAARRAADLPVATDALVRYFPHDDNGASVEVDIREGPVVPHGPMGVAGIGGRAIVLHEVRVPFAGLTGMGERIDVEYGWKKNRPRAAIRLTTPAPGPIPGLLVLEAARSRQTFEGRGDFGSGTIVQDRRGARIGLEDWATGRIHWNVDGTVNRLDGRQLVGLGGGVDTRLAGDRIAIELRGTSWIPSNADPSFGTGAIEVYWRSRATDIPGGFSGGTGFVMATASAPLTFWAGADVASSREAFLRAHKLLTNGVVTSDMFGRRLTFGTLSYERHIMHTKFATVGVVGFVDSARVWRGMIDGRSEQHTDIGLGLRAHARSFGSIRVDIGYGLRDGATAISAGFIRPWPMR